jgi:predicted RND superfamily exporter protein
MADPLQRLHEALHPDGTEATDRISSALIEQYLLLLDSTEEIGELVADDRSVANVAVRANDNGSEELLRIAELANEWWREHGVPEFTAQPTGIMFEFARAEHAIAVGQVAGVGVDIATLATLYLLVFRSAALTIIALVPSIVTVVIAFGFLGLVGAPLDAGTVFVGMLAIGVTVDETIHLVSAFSRELVAGRDPRHAMRRALERVFPALAVTTIALACGFAVLGLSSFSFTQRLGSLTAIAVVVCAAASSSLLPTLLGRYRVVDPKIK